MSEIELFVAAYLILVGLMIGSFINLAADRLPRGESVIRPRSHCRVCARQLNLIDLLPVLGYAIRGGKCATCKTPISLAAPFVEAISGGAMLVALVWFGLWPGALIGAVVVFLFGAGVTAGGFRAYTRSQVRS